MTEPVITIRCRENGPLVVPLNVRVIDHMGNEFALPQGKEVIALCRCGLSEKKPFCDGHHRGANFQAADTADRR